MLDDRALPAPRTLYVGELPMSLRQLVAQLVEHQAVFARETLRTVVAQRGGNTWRVKITHDLTLTADDQTRARL